MTNHIIRVIYGTALLLGMPAVASAASFNCAKASSSNELMICADPQLSLMDDDLATLYRAARAAAPDPTAFKKETNDEWRKRGRCVDRACLFAWYQRRNIQLSTVLNHAQIQTVPAATAAKPIVNLPVRAAPPENSSTGMSGFVWVIAGLFFFVWIIKRLGAAGRQQTAAAAARAATASKGVSSTNRPAKRTADFEIKAKWQAPERNSSPAKRSGQGVPTVWVGPGQTTVLKGLSIPGGMLYVGSTLTAPDGSIEPAQVDPTLEVDSQPADPLERLFGYWPRYDDISAIARRAYLTWLAGGRCDPNADVGYVFLFFYGLERRVLMDAKKDAAARAEVPAILTEVERLREIYSNRSFQIYTRNFLDYVVASGTFAKALYKKQPPAATSNRGMPLLLRTGLGQCAIDGAAVPATWALSWARSEPNVSLPRIATRCQEQFDGQFASIYAKRFADGIKLSINRTKLKVSYRAASAGLLTQSFNSEFGELPDVTTVVAPLKKLQGVIDEAAAGLDAYSRFIGRHEDKAGSLEATVLLPKELWGAPIKAAVSGLDARVGTGMVVIKLGELLSAFGGTVALTRGVLKSLFSVLRAERIGVEPDVLSGARTPKGEDSVVLFRLADTDAGTKAGGESAYAAVAVMLDLAITLANADGKISGREVQLLNRQVDAWAHVGESAQRRIRARLRLGIVYPPSLSSLKSRIEPLPTEGRTALAKLLVALAMVDGKLDPAEVKHLEKVYAALNIDRAVLYSDLHGVTAAAERTPQSTNDKGVQGSQTQISKPVARADQKPGADTPQIPSSTLQLDPARIAALQLESERVTALLSKVFEEEILASPTGVASAADHGPEPAERAPPRLLGLDGEHSAFLRVLLTRHSWSREELNDIAADMEMMLDGALERVNEAALDTFDVRIAEGDDPIEIAQDLMESVDA
jgi:uncharacterized protein/uncharacterized tellurite resistance protein B-like protein